MKSIIALLVLLCSYRVLSAKGNGCPLKWIRHRDTERCFYISDDPASFFVAKQYCESERSQLVPILSSYDEVELNTALLSKRGKCRQDDNCFEYWTGVRDSQGTKDWRTTEGLRVDKSRVYWAAGYPKNNAGRCVLMSYKDDKKRGALRNDNCERQLKYVCISCPYGFDYMPEINGCLHLNMELNSWKNAVKACSKIKKGSHLLTIENSAKQEAVRRYLQAQFASEESERCILSEWLAGGKIAWLGGQTENAKRCNTSYVWKTTGDVARPFTYNNWFPKRPNCEEADENCAIIVNSPEYNYRWEDQTCKSMLCSVCEF